MNFTHNKFISLSFKKQHKVCASLLKTIYEAMLRGENFSKDLENYFQFLKWMEEPDVKIDNFKDVIDNYHPHLKKACWNLQEHNLLTTQKDHFSNAPFGDIIIYLDNLRSAHNVGSILRTIEALRLGSIIFGKNTPDNQNKQVQKTAMGTASMVPIAKEISGPLIALETSEEAICLYDFIFPAHFTLALGNEEYGLSDEILQKADHLIKIPLPGYKNSLNVAVAFAITAGEINRQKIREERVFS